MYKYIYYCLLIYNIKYVKYKHMSFFEMQTYISWVRVSTGPKNFKDMVVFRCIFIGSWLPICFCKSCVVTHIQFFWGSVCGLWTLDLAPWILNACTNLNHDNGRTVLALFFCQLYPQLQITDPLLPPQHQLCKKLITLRI